MPINYVSKENLQEFATKLNEKQKTIFAPIAAIGAPLTAETAAGMTDETKVYVYTGEEVGYTYGNWYYYDGTGWVSGGVYNATAYDTDTTLTESGRPADAKVVGDASFYKEIPLFPCYFYCKNYVKSDGSLASSNYCASSIVMSFDAPFRIFSDNDNYSVQVYNKGVLGEYAQEHIVTGLVSGRLVFKKNDQTLLTTADLAHFHMYSTDDGYQKFVQEKQIKVENTRKFGGMGSASAIAKLRVVCNDADTNGMLSNASGYTGHRGTYFPYYSDSDIDIWIGRNGTITANINVDGVITTLTYGQSFRVPAGKRFFVDFITSPADYSGDFQTACIMVVKDSVPSGATQTMYNAGTNTAIQCAARVGDKTIIATAGFKYSVFQSTSSGTVTLIDNQSLGHDVGHANQGNYDNGYFYISNWENNALIHVFAFNDVTNELTYAKDITIPVEADFERIGYHVIDSEKQIYFFGWTKGRGTTQYGLYVKNGDSYKLAWRRYATVPTVINGFTVQGNFIYYPDNTLSSGVYKFKNIFRINMITGETEYNAYTPSGSVLNQESEAIIAIGDQTFLLPTHLGPTVIQTFNKA